MKLTASLPLAGPLWSCGRQAWCGTTNTPMLSLGACRPGICCSTCGLGPSPTHPWTLSRCVNPKPATIEGGWLRCILCRARVLSASYIAGLQVLPVMMLLLLSRAIRALVLQRR